VFLQELLNLARMMKAAIVGDHQDVLVRIVCQKCLQELDEVATALAVSPVPG
jgi:hypothetical protein